MDLQAGKGAGERTLAVIELNRSTGAGRQRFVQRFIKRDVDPHPLGIAHPAVDCFGRDSWPLTSSQPARIPASLLVTCAGNTSPSSASKTTRSVGIHSGVAQALLTKISDDIGMVADQHSSRLWQR